MPELPAQLRRVLDCTFPPEDPDELADVLPMKGNDPTKAIIGFVAKVREDLVAAQAGPRSPGAPHDPEVLSTGGRLPSLPQSEVSPP